MTFKEMLDRDISEVFLNTSEFADTHTILYDGNHFSNIPVVLTEIKQKDKLGTPSATAQFGNRTEGLINVTCVMYAALSDLGGVLPEKGTYISVDNGTALGKVYYDRYLIVTSSLEEGMCVLELEAVSE